MIDFFYSSMFLRITLAKQKSPNGELISTLWHIMSDAVKQMQWSHS